MKMYQMFRQAKEKGVANESKMWESVAALDPAMEILEREHPDEYWQMMRRQHEILWGPHYDETFADYDVDQLTWTGKDGQKHHGAHWSRQQVMDATAGMTFPQSTTDCDKYVAFNSFYSDMCQELDEATILKAAHRFYFQDEDAPAGKIWRYMQCMKSK